MIKAGPVRQTRRAYTRTHRGPGAAWVEQLRVMVGETADAFDVFTPTGPVLGYLPNGAVKISILVDGAWSLVELVARAQ